MEGHTLYIIGNGFDLQHEIPSDLRLFKQFVRSQDRGLLETVEKYLPDAGDWSDLESALATIDAEGLLEDLEQFMPSYGADEWSDSGHHDFQYEVERVVQCLSIELRHRLGQWIRQLPIPTLTTTPRRLKTIDHTALFLSFNYTPTLEALYMVPETNILHIHGRSTMPDDNLVLGHARNPVEIKSLNDRPDIEEIDTRLMEANSIVDRYFSRTFKPSARLIEENRSFFQRLTEVKQVHVLGHSLSKVDVPYFRALLGIPAIAYGRWHVACYEHNDSERIPIKLTTLGVQASHIATYPWSDV